MDEDLARYSVLELKRYDDGYINKELERIINSISTDKTSGRQHPLGGPSFQGDKAEARDRAISKGKLPSSIREKLSVGFFYL